MKAAKTRLFLTTLLAAGSLLIAAPASAGNQHPDHNPGYQSAHYQRDHGQRGHRKSHRRQHYGKHRGRGHKPLGHRHARPYPHYRHHKHHRPNVIVIPRSRPHYRHHRSSSGFSTITGGVIGGIVGNNLGHGDPVATGIGIMTGAVIGNRMEH